MKRALPILIALMVVIVSGCQIFPRQKDNLPPEVTKKILITLKCTNTDIADVVQKLNQAIVDQGSSYDILLKNTEHWTGFSYVTEENIDPFAATDEGGIWTKQPLSLPKLSFEFSKTPLDSVLSTIENDLDCAVIAYFDTEASIILLPPKNTERGLCP